MSEDTSSGDALIKAQVSTPWISGNMDVQTLNHGAAAQKHQTVDGFQDRRRTHMMDINEHDYAAGLKPDDTVYKYAPLSKGAMAGYLDKPHVSPTKPEPKGRTRTDDTFFQKEVPLYQ